MCRSLQYSTFIVSFVVLKLYLQLNYLRVWSFWFITCDHVTNKQNNFWAISPLNHFNSFTLLSWPLLTLLHLQNLFGFCQISGQSISSFELFQSSFLIMIDSFLNFICLSNFWTINQLDHCNSSSFLFRLLFILLLLQN